MGTGQVLALNADTLETVGDVTLGGLGYPQDLALDATSNKLYVAHALSPKYGALSVIDTAGMTLLTTLWGNPEHPLGGSDAVRVDAAHQQVFLAQNAGCLVLDSGDLSVRDTVELAPELISALAADSLEGTLYLATVDGQLWTWRASTP
jgi:DNA-binding beta-propeller fold protein YncE